MQCNELKFKLRTDQKNSSRGWVYRDECGKRWKSGKCPACKRAEDTAYSRRRGHKSIDDLTRGTVARGRRSEHTARAWLVTRGYSNVTLGNSKGPDLFATIGPRVKTFEVKTVVKQSNNAGLWVHAVAPTRKQDDFIIYVHEDICIMRSMHEHLRECWSTGACRVTQFFRPAGVKRFELKVKEAK